MRPLVPLVALLGLGIALRADPRLQFDGVTVNGQPVRAIFDTGAGSESFITLSMAQHLGLQPKPVPQAGPGVFFTHYVEGCRLHVLGSDQVVQMLVMSENDPLRSDIDVVFGWPALHRVPFLIRLSDHSFKMPSEPPADLATWQKWSIDESDKVLVLVATDPDGTPFRLLVDTGGNDSISLNAARWRAWKAENPKSPLTLKAYFGPMVGIVVAEVAEARHLEVGPLSLEAIRVEEGDATQVRYRVDATLGYDGLAAVDLYVDGRNGVAYTKPHVGSRMFFTYNRLGAVFVPGEGGLLAARVIPGSPAARAGIQDGDLLLRIGKRDMTLWKGLSEDQRPSASWELPAGTKLTLTLRRNGSEITVKPVLAAILHPPAAGKP